VKEPERNFKRDHDKKEKFVLLVNGHEKKLKKMLREMRILSGLMKDGRNEDYGRKIYSCESVGGASVVGSVQAGFVRR